MVCAAGQEPSFHIVGQAEVERRLGCRSTGQGPDWLVAAGWQDEAAETAALTNLRLRWPAASVAGLGPRGDIERFERWRTRGALVYLAWPVERERLFETLRIARELDVAIYDRCFPLALRARQTEIARLIGVAHLTNREAEVLRLLRKGLSNHEIAQALSVTLHTAEFHVGNILSKLRAANRVEAVARAGQLGL